MAAQPLSPHYIVFLYYLTLYLHLRVAHRGATGVAYMPIRGPNPQQAACMRPHTPLPHTRRWVLLRADTGQLTTTVATWAAAAAPATSSTKPLLLPYTMVAHDDTVPASTLTPGISHAA